MELRTRQTDGLAIRPATGVDLVTGRGVEEAVAGVDVVINLTNSPAFGETSPAFFRSSMGSLLAASVKGGVGHFGECGTAWWPAASRFSTTRDPISPVPPMTANFMVPLAHLSTVMPRTSLYAPNLPSPGIDAPGQNLEKQLAATSCPVDFPIGWAWRRLCVV
ncbi:hypothetical protein ABT288_39755 [Streptomyces sp. NPDC001093]|uniref:hypothetical protein n=1 Tax=Streptomyces sp. NPDC001093 TaxID=3154376 RepID=UPI00332DE5AB